MRGKRIFWFGLLVSTSKKSAEHDPAIIIARRASDGWTLVGRKEETDIDRQISIEAGLASEALATGRAEITVDWRPSWTPPTMITTRLSSARL